LQRRGIAAAAEGYYQLINQHSGLLLDVSGASTDAGANVVQWHDNAGASQQWSLVQVSSPRSASLARGPGHGTAPDPVMATTVENQVEARQQPPTGLDLPDFAEGPLGT